MKKVLLVKLSSLGDVIFNIPLANVLKSNGYEVHWIVTERGLDIVQDNPCVDKTISLPLYRWRKNLFSLKNVIEFFNIIKEIRKERYDIAFDCQKRAKGLPFMLFSGAKRRIIAEGAKEFSALGANEFCNVQSDLPHMVSRNLAYAKYIGLDASEVKFTLPQSSDETKSKIDDLLKDIDKDKPIVIISPATTWVSKHWNRMNWKKVVISLKKDCNLIFTGTVKDKELISDIGGDEFTNLAGKTSLKDLIELFSRAHLVMAPDSGSSHLAWATQKPAVITMFTSTSPKVFGCYGDDTKYYPLSGDLQCQFCYKRKCPLDVAPNLCTESPDPEKVIEIAKNIISKYALSPLF